jgi:hypothetical protein
MEEVLGQVLQWLWFPETERRAPAEQKDTGDKSKQS